MVTERPIGMDVERHIVAPAPDADYAPCPERMAHAELVPDVGVIDGEVRDNQIGHKQLLEHVRANIAGAHLLVGAKNFKPRCLKRRLNELAVDPVKIDSLFGAVGHYYERMVCHISLALTRCQLFFHNEFDRRIASIILHSEMNLVSRNRAQIAVLVLTGHVFRNRLKPHRERNFITLDAAVFNATLERQERRSAVELITFRLKQESLRVARSPSIGDFAGPPAGESCHCRRIKSRWRSIAHPLFMKVIPLPEERSRHQQKRNPTP